MSTTTTTSSSSRSTITTTTPECVGGVRDGAFALPYMYSMGPKDSMDKSIDVEVKGTIPDWLKGSLYRNGSGVFRLGDMTWKHLFDGFAVLHRWTIHDCRVTFQATVLDTDHYNRSLSLNRLVGGSFGSKFPDPCKSLFHRFFSKFLPSVPEPDDNTLVNIIELGDRLFTLTETTLINEIDPRTLQCHAKSGVGNLALHVGSAHPHFEKDGTVLYYGTNMDYRRAYNIVRVVPPADNEALLKNAEIIGSIPSRWKIHIGYSHSFGVTENYIVFMELPYTINTLKSCTLSMTQSGIVDATDVHPGQPILIHLLEKKTGHRHPVTFRAPHGIVLHFINCYEEDGHVVADVCLSESVIYKDLFMDAITHSGNATANNKANFARFVLPLHVDGASIGDNVNHLPRSQAKAVLASKTMVDVEADAMFGSDLKFELPRINYDFVNGLKYRYFYGSTVFSPLPVKKVLKFDVETKTVTEWKCGQSHEPGEPVFVPHPDAREEDDGVVLCPIVSATSEHESYLLVLDASSFQELATARLPKDIKMCPTFHGSFSSRVVE